MHNALYLRIGPATGHTIVARSSLFNRITQRFLHQVRCHSDQRIDYCGAGHCSSAGQRGFDMNLEVLR